MSECLKYRYDKKRECSRREDQGYDSCDRYAKNCCDWWPCSWACKVFSWICVAWVWISNVVCVAWAEATTAVCVLWDVFTTAINAVVGALESTIGWILDVFAFVVGLFFVIPGLGRILEWIWNAILAFVWGVVSLVDIAAGLIGIRPEKRLRVVTFILSDGSGPVVTVGHAVDQLSAAADVLRREANVRLMAHRPFEFAAASSPPPSPDASWVTTVPRSDSSDELLDLPCGSDGLAHDLGTDGARMAALMQTGSIYGRFRRLVGYGGPVFCVFIRSIPGQTEGWSTFEQPDPGDQGCALWFTDYVTVARPSDERINRRVLAHEIGHACNLRHGGDDHTNLMFKPADLSPAAIGTTQSKLSSTQAVLLRASKHVTYF
jgi:hypothetical protein